MRVQVVEVKAAEERIGRAEDATSADSGREIRTHVHTVCKALKEDGKSIALAVVWDEIVVGKSVESRARTTYIAGPSGLEWRICNYHDSGCNQRQRRRYYKWCPHDGRQLRSTEGVKKDWLRSLPLAV